MNLKSMVKLYFINFFLISFLIESTLSSSERTLTDVYLFFLTLKALRKIKYAHLFQSSPTDDNELPTAIENATHEIPPSAPTDIETINNETEPTTSDNLLTEPSLPIIVPLFDESASRVINTNEASITAAIESEPQSPDISNTPLPSQTESQTATTNNEYINPRGIRFTTSTTTPTASAPVKGK